MIVEYYLKLGFIGAEGGHIYEDFMADVLLAEEVGFDSAWPEKHHGVENHYWPSLLMRLAGWLGKPVAETGCDGR